MKAILIIDHGSKRAEANNMLACVANLVQHLVGDTAIVESAHMELAEPDIPTGFARCVERGATEVVAFPYMLSPGRHSTEDIPNLVAEAGQAHPTVPFRTADALGVHEKIAELILLRTGVPAATLVRGPAACRCWDPAQTTTACGAACRLRSTEDADALLPAAVEVR